MKRLKADLFAFVILAVATLYIQSLRSGLNHPTRAGWLPGFVILFRCAWLSFPFTELLDFIVGGHVLIHNTLLGVDLRLYLHRYMSRVPVALLSLSRSFSRSLTCWTWCVNALVCHTRCVLNWLYWGTGHNGRMIRPTCQRGRNSTLSMHAVLMRKWAGLWPT